MTNLKISFLGARWEICVQEVTLNDVDKSNCRTGTSYIF